MTESLKEQIDRLRDEPNVSFSDPGQTIDEINHNNGFFNGYCAAKNSYEPVINELVRRLGVTEGGLICAMPYVEDHQPHPMIEADIAAHEASYQKVEKALKEADLNDDKS